jgi:hypothetical protein
MGTGTRATEPGTSVRLVYLDNLKVVLIGLIIVLHAILGYSSLEVWNYSEFREVSLNPVLEVTLAVLASPFALFMIGLLFLVAGLFSRPSVERKGVGVFVRDRLLRLGVTYVVYVLLVQPTVTYALLEHPLGDAPNSYWEEWLAEEDSHRLDSGPLWFVGTLLLFSLGYAIWVVARRRLRGPGEAAALTTARITTPRLLALAGLVGLLSFVVRIDAPYGSEAGFLDLNYWEWPGCLAAFCLGIIASGQGWLEHVPDDLRRHSRTATLAAAVTMSLVLFVGGLRDVVEEEVMGGAHWLALGFSLADCVLVVFGPVWLLAVAQRHLRHPFPWGSTLARSAFGAFILQTPVLVGLAMALRPVGLPAEVKALVVALGGVSLCFALAWLLITRVPGVRRIL